MGAVSDGGKEHQRQQVMLTLLASSPGFIERYMGNRLLGSTPEAAALGALLSGGLAAEHVLQLQGDKHDLDTARAQRGVKAVAKALARMVEANLDRTLGTMPTVQ